MRKLRLILCLVILAAVVAGVLFFYNNANSRKYCQIRFGSPDAHKIILAYTSDSLLLFRSGQIDSDSEEYPLDDGRLSDGVSIPPIILQSGASYTITSVYIYKYVNNKSTRRQLLMLYVTIKRGTTTFRQYCDVELSDTLNHMKYAHFDGPLSVGPVLINWEIPTGSQFKIGGKPTNIRAIVATLDKAGGCWTPLNNGDDKFPAGVYPTITVEFPSIESTHPIVRTYVLDKFC